MSIPRDPAPDSTLALFGKDGYDFIRNRCRRFRTDVFETRFLFRKAVCMQGAEAAAIFYTPGRFTRRRNLPLLALTLIQDLGSVVVNDQEEHLRRKAMFLSLVSPAELVRLAEITSFHWRAAVQRWEHLRRVNLFYESHYPLCAAVCEWAGLRLTPSQITSRANEFRAIVDGAGAIGVRNWRGQLMRRHSERWMCRLVRLVRSGRLKIVPGSPADTICNYRDSHGRLLEPSTAAVELINILRPTVANARYLVFAAMALHQHPEWQSRLRQSDDDLDEFADEIRRFYPFVPFVGGRVLQEFSWRGHHFKRDQWVLFDIHGTNHDQRIWGDPENFRPERFHERHVGPFDLVSHGAGDRRLTHRCPGEFITVEQIKAVARLLVREMRYDVPPQDLRISPRRIPALPKSRFIMEHVEPIRNWQTLDQQ